MFREFIYLDTDRLQSVLAQLQEGLLTTSVEASEQGGTVRGELLSALFAQLLPIGGSVEGKASFSASRNKVLHDYAFTLALDALRKRRLLLEEDMLNDLARVDGEVFPLPQAGFILVSGGAQLLDYALLPSIVEQLPRVVELIELYRAAQQKASVQSQVIATGNEGRQLNRRERRQLEQENDTNNYQAIAIALSQTTGFLRQVLGDVIQLNLTTDRDVKFIGNLNRQFLREDIRSLIFKYGSTPQGAWKMLAQVSSIPERGRAQRSIEELQSLAASFTGPDKRELRSGSDFFNIIAFGFNSIQELISSVGYPDIAVAPIAVYREVTPLI